MTQEERWFANYGAVMLFIKKNGRNLSKYNLEERRLYTWVKHQRKVMNAGEMRLERIEQFRKLLEMTEQYRRKNQWQ
jgi:predicted metal-dependent RNase